jgi:hypothetical protein
MSDLRERLEAESERVSLAPGAADRMFERGRRRERSRRVGALVIGAVLFVVVLAIVRASLPGGDREPQPATPTPTAPGDIAGAYSVLLPAGDPDVAALGMNGTYTMRLDEDGTMELAGPRRFDLPGSPITFDVERGRLTTDALVGQGCDVEGVYRVALDGGALTFAPIDDRCEMRSTLLGTAEWRTTGADSTTDRLEGDWISSFSCAQMVRAVERAPVPPDFAAFWAQGVGRELGSDDPRDPCAGVTETISHTFRFDAGRLLIFDARLREGFDGAYELRANSFTIRDATTDNIQGRYRARFRLRNGTLSVDLVGRAGHDPFFVGTWESAPLLRVSD